jgi:hypothetical protein
LRHTAISTDIWLEIYKMSAGAVAGVVRLQARYINVKCVAGLDIAMNIPVTLKTAGIGSSY